MKRAVAAILIASSAVSGCFSLSQPTQRTYEYQLSYVPPAVEGTSLAAAVSVTPLRVAAVYDRTAIVYRDTPYTTGTYFYHRWSAHPGNMITDLLWRDMASSGLYRAVQQGVPLIPSDYRLSGTVEVIEEAIDGGACTARLRLRALLVRARAAGADPVVLREEYGADEPCPAQQPQEFVAAMSRCLERVSAALQRDIRDAIARDLPPPQPR